MSGYAYAFTLVTLIGLILPFFGFFVLEQWAQEVERAPMALLIGCIAPATTEQTPSQGGELACDRGQAQWVLNIGGITTSTVVPAGAARWRSVQIRGGLVVPLYFVVLAVMGAAVGMMRKVQDPWPS